MALARKGVRKRARCFSVGCSAGFDKNHPKQGLAGRVLLENEGIFLNCGEYNIGPTNEQVLFFTNDNAVQSDSCKVSQYLMEAINSETSATNNPVPPAPVALGGYWRVPQLYLKEMSIVM